MNQHTEYSEPDNTEAQPSPSIREAAGRRARALTAPGGWLDKRRSDVVDGLDDFATAEPWVRGLTFLVGTAFAVLVLGTVGGILLNGAAAVMGAIHLPEHIPGSGDGLRAAITGPIHTYLAAHLPAPLTEATAYGAWKTVGVVVGLLAFLSQGAVARLAWSAWSCATLAMVWQAAPVAGRPVATGLTAAALAVVSLFALRGISFSLRPTVINRTDVAPQITIQAPEPKTVTRARPTVVPAPTGPFDQR
ncbi:hypothetical protein AB0D10_39750 [Kitasatospora sp. NPDC048545]|uniref:hypothetical protein n=1 Tax=Kitasatospora sp. NPDC048545 TaxID=3157208 RepID=UPI0033FFC858